MKKSLVLGAVVVALLAFSPAWANPADSIAVSYDSTRVLSVWVHHPVKGDIAVHYISEIVVELNDKEVIRQGFASQSERDGQQVVYTLIDLKPGDKVKVAATCSVFGVFSETFEPLPVPEEGR
jgi:desulfoferrodoxin (superoxide reductase-like protein)